MTTDLTSQSRIILRADGDSVIGMGHFTRTLALAARLKNDFRCCYAIRTPSDDQKKAIAQVCPERIDLPAGETTHFEAFLNLLTGNEVVVLDNYYFTTDYQQAIKDKGCKLICIDDIHDRHYVADLVICQIPASGSAFSIELYTRLLTGFDCVLLRPAFLKPLPENHRKNPFESVLICFGGSDPYNLTMTVLQQLLQLERLHLVTVVTGNAYQYESALQALLQAYKGSIRVSWVRNASAEQLAGLMDTADVGIVSSSTILLESLSRNMPVITGYYVDNQIELNKTVTGKDPRILSVGNWMAKPSIVDRFQLLEATLQTEPEKFLLAGRQHEPFLQAGQPVLGENATGCPEFLISSSQADRLLNAFRQLEQEFSYTVRKAGSADVDLYFNWANDAAVRQNSIQTVPIAYESHVGWFRRKLNQPDTFLFVIEQAGTPVGQIRFDYEVDSQSYTIGYSVDAAFRGQGLGKLVVKLGIEQLVKEVASVRSKANPEVPPCRRLTALVKAGNQASGKVFEALSFSRLPDIKIETVTYLMFQKETGRMTTTLIDQK
ncbi:MAG: UDP-2,4-diacetamido-2,4,6-trideoxy-beta-L-altropyranose hydrolase [Bacteroidota bacterium]|nr:UDP-2,4-diacetamido-2,4,6-trideoxy-beta-L-altropyranose hydrolase [Bacteroidota bacterium]